MPRSICEAYLQEVFDVATQMCRDGRGVKKTKNWSGGEGVEGGMVELFPLEPPRKFYRQEQRAETCNEALPAHLGILGIGSSR